ncbi:glutamine synthetase, partial [Mycolicibacter acidiphilus]
MADDILKLVADENVEYIDARFCDLPGMMQHLTIPAAALDASAF